MKKGEEVVFCGGRYWCPTAKYDGDSVIITDDDGGKVSFSEEEWNDFLEKAKTDTLGLE